MFRLTPIVRIVLILWASFWVLDFLLSLGDRSLLEVFSLAPFAMQQGDFSSVIGILAYPLLHPTQALLPLLLSCWLFAVFGPEVERLLPGRRFLFLLLRTTLVGAGLTLLLAWGWPQSFGARVVTGAGWVGAMIAASAAMYPDRRISLIVIQVRLLPLFLVLCGLDLLGFLAQWAGKDPYGGSAIHLSGALVGWMSVGGFQRFRMPWSGLQERQAARKAAARKEQDQAQDERLDAILAKISREGMQSLSNAEKRFLLRRSKDQDRT